MTWAKRKEMTWSRLLEGPGDMVILPVAPTMGTVTYHGEKYHRMAMTQSSWREGEDRGEHSERGGAYLWAGWWDSVKGQRREGGGPGGVRSLPGGQDQPDTPTPGVS